MPFNYYYEKLVKTALNIICLLKLRNETLGLPVNRFFRYAVWLDGYYISYFEPETGLTQGAISSLV